MKTSLFPLPAVLSLLLSAPIVLAQSSADLQEAVDASFGPWDLGGAQWSRQSEFTLDGKDAARKTGGHGPRVTVIGPAKLHFSYRSGIADFLSPAQAYVQVDSAPWVKLITSPYWLEGSIQVGAGTHLISWTFTAIMNSSDLGARPDLAVYLDQVWTEDDPRPRVTSESFVEAPLGSETLYQITTNKPCDAFEGSELPPGMTLNATTGLISWTPLDLGSFPVRVKASNAVGSHTRSVVFRVLQPSAVSALGVEEALDGAGQPRSRWSQQYDLDTTPWWGSLTDRAKDGIDAAIFPLRVPPLADIASHWLQSQVQGPGTFSLWHRQLGFPNSVGLPAVGSALLRGRFNGKSYFTGYLPLIGPQWAQVAIPVPPGRHLVEFSVAAPNPLAQTDRPNGDALVLFDQASIVTQPQSFTFRQWMKTTYGYIYAGSFPQELVSRDEERDGLSLLLEYALGGSPIYNDAGLLPEIALIDGYLTMTVHKSPGTSGLEYSVLANKSLASNGWTTFGTEIIDEDENVLVVRCTKPVAQEPTCMLRLRVRLLNADGS